MPIECVLCEGSVNTNPFKYLSIGGNVMSNPRLPYNNYAKHISILNATEDCMEQYLADTYIISQKGTA